MSLLVLLALCTWAAAEPHLGHGGDGFPGGYGGGSNGFHGGDGGPHLGGYNDEQGDRIKREPLFFGGHEKSPPKAAAATGRTGKRFGVGINLGGRPVVPGPVIIPGRVTIPVLPGRVVIPGAVRPVVGVPMTTFGVAVPPVGVGIYGGPMYGMQPPPLTGQLPEIWPLMVKLRLSAQLRDNLVNVFGYILYRPKMVLDVQLYVALFDLYNGARLRRIRTAELLYPLKQISFMNPQQQFITFMTELNTIVPRYLLGACTMWLDALRNNKVNMNDILRPGGGPLQADFLTNIDVTLLDTLMKPSRFKPSSQNFISRIALDSMGRFFNNIMGALNDRSLTLTTGIVAGLMLHMQLQRFMPEVDEAQRYLADILFEERTELTFCVENVPQSEKQDPYALVRFVLGNLAHPRPGQNVESNIQEAAQTIITHLLPPSFLTYNPDHQKVSPIVSSKDINYELLFRVISPGEFPDDIIKARDFILNAIKRNDINMKLVTTGFVRYDYTKPRDLLVALLDRIKRRIFLPKHLSEPLLALIVHLKLKIAAINQEPRKNKGKLEVEMLFNGFNTPSTPKDIRDKVTEVWNILQLEINWDKEKISDPEDEYNSRPRQRLIEILKKLVDEGKIRNIEVVEAIEQLIDKLDNDGNPKSCPVMVCPSVGADEPTSRPVPVATTTTTTTEAPPVRAETTPAPGVKGVDLSRIIGAIQAGPEDEPKLGKLRAFLQEPQIMAILDDIDVGRYPTQGLLLQAIFQQLLQSSQVRQRTDIYQVIQKFVGSIQMNGYGAQPWRSIVRTVDLTSVFEALDTVRMQEEDHGEALQRLFDFLQGITNFNINTIPVNDLLGLTKGQFLQQFFKRLTLDASVLPYNKQDIQLATEYILMDGPGEQIVPYTEVPYD